MAIKDLIPWNNRGREVGFQRGTDIHPFFYGRFERRIPLQDVEQDKASAAFKNGVLTVTVPKSAEAKSNVRRIAINRNG